MSGIIKVIRKEVSDHMSIITVKSLKKTFGKNEVIHFPDEVRSVSDVPNIPGVDTVVQKELETALMLVDQLTTEFDPTKYTDEYRTALMQLIEDKKAESTVTATDKRPLPDNVTDLMSALQASLDKTKKKPTRKRTTKTKKNA